MHVIEPAVLVGNPCPCRDPSLNQPFEIVATHQFQHLLALGRRVPTFLKDCGQPAAIIGTVIDHHEQRAHVFSCGLVIEVRVRVKAWIRIGLRDRVGAKFLTLNAQYQRRRDVGVTRPGFFRHIGHILQPWENVRSCAPHDLHQQIGG